ncbi:hypothetical protein GFV14_00318 [Candidatus Hartigia pinicola]|nr:hypothetical protein GFV14_00318 [Candidatus Hartigia pinicola]
MFLNMPALNYQEQQEAVNKIHKLMTDGMKTGEAITYVAKEIRNKYKDKEQIYVLFEDHD